MRGKSVIPPVEYQLLERENGGWLMDKRREIGK